MKFIVLDPDFYDTTQGKNFPKPNGNK